MSLEFSLIRLLLAILCTIVPFLWLRKRELKEQLFVGTFVAFTFIYSGFGFAWEDCSFSYIWLYSSYLIFWGISIYLAQRGYSKITPYDARKTFAIKSFVNKFGNRFIFLYLLLCILHLVVEGKISNLLHTPELDMESAVAATFEEKNNGLLYYLKSIVYVFYIVALFKHKDNLLIFITLLLFPVYIEYANSCYLGRGTLMVNLIIIIIVCCMRYPMYRKKIILSLSILIPVLIWGLSWYSFYRKGLSFSMSLSDATTMLLYSETSYPEHFNTIKKWDSTTTLIYPYFEWLFTLPLPGFLKNGSTDYGFNFIFSERLLGLNRGVSGFNVLLPGVVNESLFIFGKFLFPIHAIIYGTIIGKLYKLLKHNGELFLLIFCCINGAYTISRAGTQACYPFFFKHLLIYLIVIYIYSKLKFKDYE